MQRGQMTIFKKQTFNKLYFLTEFFLPLKAMLSGGPRIIYATQINK
jgi:hypothetical protein